MVYENIIEATEEFNSKYCIGEGGTGSVYKAELSTGQVVAVKKLHANTDGDDHEMSQYLKAFTIEIQTLTQIRHLNIVKLYGFYSHPRQSFLVYEFIEGGSLRNVLKMKKKQEHLNMIKLMFLILGLPDFSIQTHPTRLRLLELSDMLLQEVNEKCDVYSFGVVTLEILGGRHPGDLISSLSSSLSLSSSKKPAYHQVEVMDVLDQRLSAPSDQEAGKVLYLAKVAFACLNGTPQSHPTMKQVAQKLSTHTHHLLKPFALHTLGDLLDFSDSTS
ncbi:MDIS1-interacting receptor like kinase 2-like [Ziziphus jujuba]|uniref:non-specific serine/threonine protein kinase n=1 Tax=Ziziphus jujuba TaxID=326968 RepID=A0ABM3ZTT6_ZIZJJ|nr:MDIS1-interacting receptor like kinase 2-like [Ziziphus jujuba]